MRFRWCRWKEIIMSSWSCTGKGYLVFKQNRSKQMFSKFPSYKYIFFILVLEDWNDLRHLKGASPNSISKTLWTEIFSIASWKKYKLIDPQGRPTATACRDHYFHKWCLYVCPSVRTSFLTFKNFAKLNKFKVSTSLANLIIHQAPCSVIACYWSDLSLLALFCFWSGRTDTMCEMTTYWPGPGGSIVITIGWTVGLAEWIIYDTHVLFLMQNIL